MSDDNNTLILDNVLWVPRHLVTNEARAAFTYKFEKINYVPQIDLPRQCANCHLWDKKWRPGKMTCAEKGYTLDDVCKHFDPKKLPVVEEVIIKTHRDHDDDWTMFARGDLGKIERIFGKYPIQDNRSAPKLDFPLKCTRELREEQAKVVRQWLKHGYGLLKAPTGWGKCTIHTHRCYTNHGLLTFSQICKLATGRSAEELPDGIAFDVPRELGLYAVAQGYRQPITHVTKHTSPMVEVKTGWGYRIKVTPEHPLMAIKGRSGTLEWVQAKDLTEDYKVAVRAAPLEGDVPDVSAYDSRREGGNRHTTNEFKPELARLMGALTADGTVTLPNGFRWNKSYNRIVDDFCLCVDAYGVRYSRRNVGKCKDSERFKEEVGVSSAAFREFLSNLGLAFETVAGKRVPWIIFQSGQEMARQFLRGYFTGDGDVEKKKLVIQVISASEELLLDVQMLLLSFGIPCSIAPKTTTYKGKELRNQYWRLTIDREFLKTFHEQIGFLPGCHKEEDLLVALEERSRVIPNTNKYTIPASQLMRQMYLRAKVAGSSISSSKLREHGVEHYTSPSNSKLPPPSKMNEFLSVYQTYNEYAEWEALNVLHEMSKENGVFWVPVESVVDAGTDVVVDLTVPDKHYFVANGFVSHNTVTWAWLIAKMGLRTLLLSHETRHLSVAWEGLLEHTNIAELEEELGVRLCGVLNHDWKWDTDEHGNKYRKLVSRPGAIYPITFATYQGFGSKRGKKLRKQLKNYFGVVWCEECLTGDTLIPTSKGLLRLDSIVEDPTKSQDYKVDVGTRWGVSPTRRFVSNGERRTLHIETKLGNAVTVTYEHKMLVLDPKTYDLNWVEAQDLSCGDLLCVTSDKVTRKDLLPLSLTDADCISTHSGLNIVRKPTHMTPDLAFAIGCLIAEGGLYPDHRVEITNTNDDLLTAFSSKLQAVFGVSPNKRLQYPAGTQISIGDSSYVSNKECYSSTLCSLVVCTWLQELGVVQDRARHKKVPWSILQADEESQLAFLAAYVECDGFIAQTGGYIGFSSSSRDLLAQIQCILFSHGFTSPEIKRTDKRSADYIRMSEEDSEELYKRLSPWMTSKVPPKKYRRGSKLYGIPADGINSLFLERSTGRVAREGRIFLNDEGQEVSVPYVMKELAYASTPKKKVITYNGVDKNVHDKVLNQLNAISPSMSAKINNLLVHRYRFIPVTSIKEAGVQKVYDLTLEDAKNRSFVANGLVSSNCHHESATTYHAVTKSFNPFYRGGQTATPTRKDQTHVAIYDTLGPVTAEGVKEQMIPRVYFHNTNILVPDKVFNHKYVLPMLCNYLARNAFYQEAVLNEIVKEIEEGRKVLLITERRHNAFSIRDKVRAHGYNAELIIGQSKMKPQDWYAKELLANRLHLIIGTKVIDENINIPPMDSVHFPFPNFVKEKEQQRVGRIRRQLTGDNIEYLKELGIEYEKPQPRVHVYTWHSGNDFHRAASGFREKLYASWDFEFDQPPGQAPPKRRAKTMKEWLEECDGEGGDL